VPAARAVTIAWATMRPAPLPVRGSRRGLLHGGKTLFGMLKLMRRICRVRPVLPPSSAFTGFRFPREVIVLAVRWYLRYGLSYRDVEELLAERGVQVDHVKACSYTAL
jgi:hypothetical protein